MLPLNGLIMIMFKCAIPRGGQDFLGKVCNFVSPHPLPLKVSHIMEILVTTAADIGMGWGNK